MIVRHQLIVCGVLTGVLLAGCRTPHGQDKNLDTMIYLQSTCKMILVAESESGQSPPTEMKKLTAWLQQWSAEKAQYIDYDNGRISDGWGQDVRLLAEAGKLEFLASLGANGIWDQGQGDDIVVQVSDWKIVHPKLDP